MVIITPTINVYIKIRDNFLILSIENWFRDDEVICLGDNLSCYRASDKSFSPGKAYKINNMAGEQSGCKSTEKFMVILLKNSP